MDEKRPFEVLRSGFLSDGTFYSVEASRRKHMEWEAWIARIPGDQLGVGCHPPAVKVGSYKEELCRWAEKLTVAEVEQLIARSHVRVGTRVDPSVNE